MKINFIKNEVSVKKVKKFFDIDFQKLLEILVQESGFDINNLSDENRDDIITEFESTNYNEYLKKVIGISIENLPDMETDGFDLDDNSERLQKVFDKFAEFVYNY